jgi:hypothetical protein
VFKLRFKKIFAKEKTGQAIFIETAAYRRGAPMGGS